MYKTIMIVCFLSFLWGWGESNKRFLPSAIITAVKSAFYRIMHFVRRAVETVNTVSV